MLGQSRIMCPKPLQQRDCVSRDLPVELTEEALGAGTGTGLLLASGARVGVVEEVDCTRLLEKLGAGVRLEEVADVFACL